jgi:hypothetical protein
LATLPASRKQAYAFSMIATQRLFCLPKLAYCMPPHEACGRSPSTRTKTFEPSALANCTA